MKWAVSCFEPFGDASTNSSAIVHARLKDRDWAGRVDFLKPLPVSFGHAWLNLERQLRMRPAIGGVLMLGQAAGRRQVDLECLALNRVDTASPDNIGLTPPPGPVVPGDPDVRWSSIPWADLAVGASCARSYSAGTFVCNALYYAGLRYAADAGLRAGFVHIPALDSQPEFADLPRMGEDAATAALARILDLLIDLPESR